MADESKDTPLPKRPKLEVPETHSANNTEETRPRRNSHRECHSANGTEDSNAEMMPTICVMGATGVGKGSTLNSCFCSDKFSVGHMFASDTVKPAAFVLPWRGTGDAMRGVDLCGFSDSEGRDTSFIESMVSYLRGEVKYVHCFLLLFNSQETRIGMHLKDMLMSLKTVFGLSFMKNVMIGFTRWEYTKRASILRRDVTKEALTKNVNSLLRDVLGHDHDCPCIFIDNTVSMCTDEELQELYSAELPAITAAFTQAVEAIRHFAVGHAAFHCAEIEGTVAERDIGRDMMEREEASYAEGRASFESLHQIWDDLDIEEPDGLLAKLQDAVQAKRSALNQFLTAKTKPDLEHVKVSVIGSFDAKVADEIDRVCWKNKNTASSFNRDLRQALVESYSAFIAEILKGQSKNSHEQFQEICKEDREVISRYLEQCKGGSLSWASFTKMQDQLRWEQLVARQNIFGKDFDGSQLPNIREFLNNSKDVISFLGTEDVPAWLLKLANTTTCCS